VLVVVILASSFAALFGTAAASSTTYALTGFVDQPSGPLAPPVPAGVTVDLISRATGAVYTTTVTGSGGQFTFSSSGTSGALAPGYWGLYVPPASNVSLTGCKHCAVLPQAEEPTYRYYSAAVLTNSTNHTQLLTNVSILPYVSALNGTVKLNGSTVAGATVRLLAPMYAGFAFASNTTNASGVYNLSIPEGKWIVQASYSQGSQLYTNTSLQTISVAKPPHLTLNLVPLSISGRVYSNVTKAYVATAGNATLYDPTNDYIYTTATPPGGYYAFPSYAYAFNFTSGKKQNFTIGVDPVGFQPSWFNVTLSTPKAVTQQVYVNPLGAGNLGYFNTTLNLGGFAPASGTGALRVDTNVTLHNDTVLTDLPNASVGQLWAQLGLDFAHALSLPATDVASNTSVVGSWIQSQGPFFPAIQASTTINGTGFSKPSPAAPQVLKTFASTCSSGTCGIASGAKIAYNWTTNYTLNGTAPKGASTYVLSFGFAHPATSTQVYNYKVVLPAHYALYANTTAPAQSTLLGNGPESTWTTFTLESKESSTSSATATFTIVREKNLTANVAITSANSTFTSGNILNATHYNYTVVLGVHENATFSAAKSVYPAGVNGTQFQWNFGDGSTVVGDLGSVNTPNVTTNHTYLATGTYHGTLKIISSSGLNNSTTFNVSVVNTAPVAGIASNATSAEKLTIAHTPVLVVNWTRNLHFNSTATTITAPNKLSIATYSLKARNYTATANFSTAKGANPKANWTVAFGANTTNSATAPGHGVYVNFTTVKVNNTAVGITGWGWIYNLTLEVWSLVGTNSTTHMTILVRDTEPPIAKVTLETANGTAITNGSIVEGPNHYAVVKLNASGSTDYGNGSVVAYAWTITNTNKSFTNISWHNTTVKPLPTLRLSPRTSDYKVNLTVTDKAGNKGNATVSLEVAENTTVRPVLEANNLTGPTSVNAGTTYTYWVNITVGGGSKSVAHNISVSFYLLSSSGSGSRTYVGGSPGSVTFYGYSGTGKNATVNSSAISTGLIQSLKYNKTVRAVLHWSPSKSGSFILYANATATNQFVNGSQASVASTSITVHTNPTTQDLEYGGIAAAVIVVLALLILFFRRRTRKPGSAKPSTSKSGLERSAKHEDDDEDA